MQLRNASTLLALHMSLSVLVALVNLNRFLQSTYQAVAGMLQAVTEVTNEPQNLRSNEAFKALLHDVTNKQTDMDLEVLQVPRQRRPPRRFTGPADSTIVALCVTDHYRPIYYDLIETANVHLQKRFMHSPGLEQYSTLEQALLGGIEGCCDVLKLYPEIDVDDLRAQLSMFRRTRPVKTVSEAVTFRQQMIPEVRAEYPQVCQLVRLLLVSPASSAEAERSFSALRRLKT